MLTRATGAARGCVAIISAALLSACGLPAAGPYYEDIRYANTVGENAGEDPGFDLIEVTPAVIQNVNVDEPLGFQMELIEAAPEKTSILGIGDVISVTIWERGENGLYSPVGGATSLSSPIEETGNIYLPYLGNVRAAGRTPDGLRRHLTGLLKDRTLDPQVEVKRETGDSKSITITGTAGVAAVVPIERTSRSLLSLLSSVGFTVDDPEVIRIIIRRGPLEGSIWMRDLFENPDYDVPVRAGDIIFLNNDTRTFRMLGAVGQGRVPFPTRNISVLDAISLNGGLNSAASDPSGVFIFRVEPPEIATRISERATVDTRRNIIYLIDLSTPQGFFMADTMLMRDDDIVYVTDAPFTRFQKVAGSIAAVVGFAGSANSAAGLFGAQQN